MDPVALAEGAVALVSPYLAKFGEHAVEKLGDEVPELGGKLFGWLRGKMGKHVQVALDDLAAKPESQDNQADLRKQLVKALEADLGLAEELTRLLPKRTEDAGAMNLNVTGAGAKGAMVRGDGNVTQIS
jgi:hypothetical protein